jgi:hypothetical protein
MKNLRKKLASQFDSTKPKLMPKNEKALTIELQNNTIP